MIVGKPLYFYTLYVIYVHSWKGQILKLKFGVVFLFVFHKRNRIRNKKSREHAKENGKDVLRSNPNHR